MKKIIRYLLIFAFTLSMICAFTSCKKKNENSNDSADVHTHIYTNDICDICGAEKPSEGLEFALSYDGKCYSVVGIGNFTGSNLVIPSTYNGLPVTRIEAEAFFYTKGIKRISIPSSITCFCEFFLPGIYEEALNLEFNEYDNAYYIGDHINPYTILVKAKTTDITSCNINQNTKVIYYAAFNNCQSLTELTIPEGVTSISNSAFYGCKNLKALKIPESVTYFGSRFLDGCDSLSYTTYGNATYFGNESNPYLILKTVNVTAATSFNVPDGTKMIYDSAFFPNENINEYLNTINLPESLCSIGRSAFAGCIKLKNITLPSNLSSIEKDAFNACKSLESINIPDSVYMLFGNSFSYCTSLKNVKIGNGITEIFGSTFIDCTSLESVDFPAGLRKIGVSAFLNCKSLKSVILPNTVTRIDMNAFTLCSSIETIRIPSSIKQVSFNAFGACDSLKYNDYGNAKYLGNDRDPYVVLVKAMDTSITTCEINEDAKLIMSSAFSECTMLKSIRIPDSVVSMDALAFYSCTSLESVTLGNGLTQINDSAFSGCTSLTKLTFGKSITDIGQEAFLNCSSLESIVLPDSLKNIDKSAFSGCTNVKEITFGKNLESMNSNLFISCPKLTKVVIPKSVTTIHSYAFEDCENLTIYCEAASKPDGWAEYWCSSIKEVVWGYSQ